MNTLGFYIKKNSCIYQSLPHSLLSLSLPPSLLLLGLNYINITLFVLIVSFRFVSRFIIRFCFSFCFCFSYSLVKTIVLLSKAQTTQLLFSLTHTLTYSLAPHTVKIFHTNTHTLTHLLTRAHSHLLECDVSSEFPGDVKIPIQLSLANQTSSSSRILRLYSSHCLRCSLLRPHFATRACWC